MIERDLPHRTHHRRAVAAAAAAAAAPAAPADAAAVVADLIRDGVARRRNGPAAGGGDGSDVDGRTDRVVRRARVGQKIVVRTALDVHVRLLVLAVRLAVVEVVEVRDDDRDRKRDRQHAGDGAQRPDESAPRRDRRHVPVADGRHRHHRPPEGVRNALELRIVLLRLGEKDRRGEENDADEEKEDEQAEFTHARSNRLTEYLQSFRMSGQLEYPEDSDEPDDAKDRQRHCLIVRRRRRGDVVGNDRRQRDEVRRDGDDVDEVHQVLEERQMIGRCGEADDQLRCEPDDARRLDDEERFGELRNVVLFELCGRIVDLHLAIALEARQRFEAEGDDGEEDDTDGDDGDDARGDRTFRVFKQQPHGLLHLVRRHDALFLAHETLVLAIFFDDFFAELIELDLIGEDLERHVYRTSQTAAALKTDFKSPVLGLY